MSLFNPIISRVCNKCGYVSSKLYERDMRDVEPCPVCNNTLEKIDKKLGKKLSKGNGDKCAEFIEQEYNIKFSDETHQLRRAYYRARVEKYNQPQQNAAQESLKKYIEAQKNAPKCPTCGSTDITNIGTVERAVSVGTVGLASGKIGKTRKCKKCGYMW